MIEQGHESQYDKNLDAQEANRRADGADTEVL